MAVLHDECVVPLEATDRKALHDTGVALGSARDFARRMRLLLPQGWFPAYRGEETEDAPVLQALLTGYGAIFSHIWQLMKVVSAQSRLGQTSASFLDMAAVDFFGSGSLTRLRGEKDTHYRRRMIAGLVAPRNTRQAVSEAIQQIAGAHPRIIEPGNARDCGAWCLAGGYGAGMHTRYGCRMGGQFILEILPKIPIERRQLNAAIKATKAAGVIAWVRIIE